MGLDVPLEWIEWLGDVMPGRDVLRILGFWKRRELRFNHQSRQLSFSDLIRSISVSSSRNESRCAIHVCGGQHCMISIGPYELCCQGQKEINSFISETELPVLLLLISQYTTGGRAIRRILWMWQGLMCQVSELLQYHSANIWMSISMKKNIEQSYMVPKRVCTKVKIWH